MSVVPGKSARPSGLAGPGQMGRAMPGTTSRRWGPGMARCGPQAIMARNLSCWAVLVLGQFRHASDQSI
jgi:hypothetical protein